MPPIRSNKNLIFTIYIKKELLSMKSHKMLALRRIICLYNSGDEQQKRLTVIIVLFLLCFCFSISSINMISISSNLASTL